LTTTRSPLQAIAKQEGDVLSAYERDLCVDEATSRLYPILFKLTGFPAQPLSIWKSLPDRTKAKRIVDYRQSLRRRSGPVSAHHAAVGIKLIQDSGLYAGIWSPVKQLLAERSIYRDVDLLRRGTSVGAGSGSEEDSDHDHFSDFSDFSESDVSEEPDLKLERPIFGW
jgi:hypothetical protein